MTANTTKKIKNTMHKLLSLYLTVAMVTVLFTVPSYAEEEEQIAAAESAQSLTLVEEDSAPSESAGAESGMLEVAVEPAVEAEVAAEPVVEVVPGAEVEAEEAVDSAAEPIETDEVVPIEEPVVEPAEAVGEESAELAPAETDVVRAEEPEAQAESADTEEPAVASEAQEPVAQARTLNVAAQSAAAEVGDFTVEGEGEYTFNATTGVLTISKGILTVANKAFETATNHRIVIEGDSEVTLAGVNIEAVAEAAVKVLAGVEAVLHLSGDNSVAGGSNHAGVEVGYEDGNMATLTIDGDGSLSAQGGSNSAGIGASYTNKDLSGKSIASYSGNIIINGGTIEAVGNAGGAGIGHANNNRLNSDGTSNPSASFKMGYDQIGSITINDGSIHAVGSNSAGIGGGNHTDSGLVTINGGDIVAEGASGIGCGTGSSKYSSSEKGPGNYFATVVINGGTILARATGEDNWGGAGIGGGAYCDASVTIAGNAVVDAYGGSCGSGHNSLHHGGAGIGGGYEGHAQVTINGGTVNAYVGDRSSAAAIGSGATPNSNEDRGTNGRGEDVFLESTQVSITGGTVTADATHGRGGAGIGGGVSADGVSVEISGGTVNAYGAKSDADAMQGGAGIGSGLYGAGERIPGTSSTESGKYHVETPTYVSITGGEVLAVGGWGAAGIGSGADNQQAIELTIDATNSSIEAYSDGTKFAIDTRVLDDDGSTSSAPNTNVVGSILQGTFVHEYEAHGIEQNPEGLSSIIVTNDATGESKELVQMPDGYRGYATNVAEAGVYTVYTDVEEIGEGGGRYFAKVSTDQYADELDYGNLVQYMAKENSLSDNYYLFPVKTIVVEKIVRMDESVSEEAVQELLDAFNETFYFALQMKNADGSKGDFIRNADGDIWVLPVVVKNGAAQNKAYFVGIQDATYDVLEVSADGSVIEEGMYFGAYTLSRIATAHGTDTTNNAAIGPDVWSDMVSVINYFTPLPLGPDDPDEPDDPVDPDPDPVDPVDPDPVDPVDPVDPDDPDPIIPDDPDPVVPVDPDPIVPVDPDPVVPDQGGVTPVQPGPAAPMSIVPATFIPAAPVAAASGAVAKEAAPLVAHGATAKKSAPPVGLEEGVWCWVHWWIMLGLLVTGVYSMAIAYRRRRSSDTLQAYEEEVLGVSEQVASPAFVPNAQPAQ